MTVPDFILFAEELKRFLNPDTTSSREESRIIELRPGIDYCVVEETSQDCHAAHSNDPAAIEAPQPEADQAEETEGNTC